MKKKLPTKIKDGITGFAIGTAIIVPGISGGTIALVFGAFKKIVDAVDNLFSKKFLQSVLILLPFLIGAVIAVFGLMIPFKLAYKYCMLAIICLFAGFIIGSFPSITDQVKEKRPSKINFFQIATGFIIATLIGVLSVIFNFYNSIQTLFLNRDWYLYTIIFFVGFIGSTGLIVPGFSGSLLLLVICFYQPILNLFYDILSFTNFWSDVSLGFVFAIGVLVGFIIFSKLMNNLITNHKRSTLFVVIGFIAGSLISIFINSQIFDYYQTSLSTLDLILSPILLAIGLVLSSLFVTYTRQNLKKNA